MEDLALDASADLEDVLPRQVRLVAERAEERVRAVEERERRVELGDAARVHDEHAVVVHCARGRTRVYASVSRARGAGGSEGGRRTDGVEAVGDAEEGRGRELGLDRALYFGVRLNVDAARRFVLHDARWSVRTA